MPPQHSLFFYIHNIHSFFISSQIELNLQGHIDLYHPGRRAVIPWRLDDSPDMLLLGGGLDMLLLGGSNEPPWYDGSTGGGKMGCFKC